MRAVTKREWPKSVQEVANLLGTNRSAVQMAIHRERLKATKRAGALWIEAGEYRRYRGEIEAWRTAHGKPLPREDETT
jgi:excisionase family DNA binding protein